MTETIPCPLCSGEGKLKRTEILDRLGMRDVCPRGSTQRGRSFPPAPEQARP